MTPGDRETPTSGDYGCGDDRPESEPVHRLAALPPPRDDDRKWRVWRALLRASLSIPGARVDRPAFLRAQLRPYVPDTIVEKAVNERPALAGIPRDLIDRLADSSVRWHVAEVSAISFVTGLPGGWWVAGTIPADLAQFYWHAVVLSQKLAYLYGWPELLDEDNGVDDETILRITLFVGVMMGAQAANRSLAELAERFAAEVARRLPRQALTQYGLYNVAKQIGKWIGIQITKSSFSRALSRVIPIVSGFISAGLSAAFMIPMARRLKGHLRTLRYARE